MVELLPFAGWRYDMSQVGALSDVICGMPESIAEGVPGRDPVDELYQLHPCNAIRLVMNRDEPGDTSASDRYTRIEDFFELWKREELLFQEHDPALYVVEESSVVDRDQPTCVSVIGRIRIQQQVEFGPSELMEITQRCQAQFIPIQAVVINDTIDCEEGQLFHSLIPRLAATTPIEVFEDNGRHLRIWVVTDRALVDEIQGRVTASQVRVVGGRDQYRALQTMAAQGQQEHYGLFWLTDGNDPGLSWLHRTTLVSGVGVDSFESLRDLLKSSCRVEYVGDEPNAADDAIELARLNELQPVCCVGTKDGKWGFATFLNASGVRVTAGPPEQAQEDLRAHILECLGAGASPLRDPGTVADRYFQDGQGVQLLLAGGGPGTVALVIAGGSAVKRIDEVIPGVIEGSAAVCCIPRARVGLVYYSIET
ncbi:MAG: DUF1015 family protein [Planctomyces sp.]|nr:DUF1015 family protein [Planctomyces sp.]